MRCALAWLLVPMLAFRALTALYVDLQGPLHFHLEDDHHHEHHDPAHTHSHDRLERHHHAAGDSSVVTLEAHDGFRAEESIASGWSSTMCVAAASTHAWPDPPPLRERVVAAGYARYPTRSLGRLDRPPRTPFA
jgi:hypothetical protein